VSSQTIAPFLGGKGILMLPRDGNLLIQADLELRSFSTKNTHFSPFISEKRIIILEERQN
jgi:hypothetical protein